MQADSLGAIQNPGDPSGRLEVFPVQGASFSPLVPAATSAWVVRCGWRFQPRLSLARLERSPARP
jgi:hypothetical protein